MRKKLSTKEQTFLKNLFLTTILGGIIGVLNYLFNIFIARFTSQHIFSIFSATLGIIYIIQIPSTAIQSAVTKSVAKEKQTNLNHYKWFSFGIFAILGMLFSILFFLCRNAIAGITNIPVETVLFLAISLFFAFTSPVSKGLLLGKEKIGTVNLVLLLETLIRFAMGAIAIKLGGSIPILILANSLPAILTTIVILPMVKFPKREKEEKGKINFKEVFLITLSFLFLTGPFMLSMPLVNPEFRAEFSAISILGKLVYYASVLTSSVLFARLTNETEEKSQRKSLMISLLLSISTGTIISILFFLFKDFIIQWSVGKQYASVGPYIGGFGLDMTAFAFVYMTANYFISKEDYKYLYILAIATFLQIALFQVRNDSLDMVMQNQSIVYGFMTIMTTFYLLFKLKRKENEEEKKDKETF